MKITQEQLDAVAKWGNEFWELYSRAPDYFCVVAIVVDITRARGLEARLVEEVASKMTERDMRGIIAESEAMKKLH